MTAELLAAFGRLLDLQHSPRDIAFLSLWIQREIVYRVLKSRVGQRLRLIATAGDHSQRTVKIREASPHGVSGAHRRHECVHAPPPLSPHHLHESLQYQKQLRLQAARPRMIADGLDAASAAFAVGYESASQFNREYSRFFGQPPLRDVRAARLNGYPSLESMSQ